MSVIIASYNRAVALRQTLEALGRQSIAPQDYEVIVVDDGSPDDTFAVARGISLPCALRVFRHERNRGVSAARNTALREARGEILVLLSDDLIVPADFLATHLATLRQYRNHWVVGGFQQLPSLADSPFGRYLDRLEKHFDEGRKQTEIAENLWEMSWPTARNLSLRRSDYDRIGPFDEQFVTTCEDQDWAERARRFGIRFLYNASITCLHNDQAGDLTRYCRFQMRGAEDTARFCAKYPQVHGGAPIARVNGAVSRHDGLALVVRKGVKRALAFAPVRGAIERTIRVAERIGLPEPILWALYKKLIGIYTFIGWRRGSGQSLTASSRWMHWESNPPQTAMTAPRVERGPVVVTTGPIPSASRRELLAPALAVLALLVACLITSSKKWFWHDELIAHYIIADPVFSHVGRALNDTLEFAPPLYFVLAWVWARIFDASETSLRLFSSIGFGVACVTIWATLRRIYAFWPATLGALAIFCLSDVILYQNAEAYAYGLFSALFAVCVHLLDRINRQTKPSAFVLGANAVAHGAMAVTHVFGLVYSGGLLLAMLLRDRSMRVWRPAAYLSVVGGWAAWLLYLPFLGQQTTFAYPRGWILVPNLKDFIDTVSLSPSPFVQVVLLLLFSVFALGALEATDERQGSQSPALMPLGAPERGILWVACVLVAIPWVAWIFSHILTPMFMGRYLIPSNVAWGILIAHVSARLLPIEYRLQGTAHGRRRLVGVIRDLPLYALVVMMIAHPLYVARKFPTEARPGSLDERYGHADLPILVPFSLDFMKRIFYSPNRTRYFFILDWEMAIDPASGSFPPGEFKTLDALERNYPERFAGQVVSGDAFLGKNDRFLVLATQGYDKACSVDVYFCPRWLQVKVLANPQFKVTRLGDIDERTLLLLVERSG